MEETFIRPRKIIIIVIYEAYQNDRTIENKVGYNFTLDLIYLLLSRNFFLTFITFIHLNTTSKISLVEFIYACTISYDYKLKLCSIHECIFESHKYTPFLRLIPLGYFVLKCEATIPLFFLQICNGLET